MIQALVKLRAEEMHDPAAHAASPIRPPARFEASNGLTLLTTTTAESDVFARFFAGYDKAFVLPNEKEDVDGFAKCFELNEGAEWARLSTLYGRYSEISVVAEHVGAEIGGANFLAMPADAETVTANLNYIYIAADARGRGYLGKLYNAVRELIAAIFSARQVLVFIEQNDPLRMSAEDYRRDTEFTGLDQLDRLRIWAKLGARVVDFGYRQPPLSAEQEVDDTLLYSVLGAEGGALNACVLEGHLTRFFGVSVLKGAEIGAIPAAREQLAALREGCLAGASIALIDPAPLLARIAGRADMDRLWRERPADFRAALRAV